MPPAPELPTISVVMGVYNADAYVAEAVESILNQSFDDFEFVIVNDGSTDRSGEIVEAYARRDPRVRVLHQPNGGIAAAANRGLGAACGRYVARMDADDVALPDRLAKQVAFLDAHPEVGAVGGAIQMIDGKGRLGEVIRFPTDPRAIKAQLIDMNVIANPGTTIRRDLISELGGYRSAFPPAEDYDFYLRLNERAEIANLPDIVVRYRVHGLNTSQLRLLKRHEATVLARASARSRRRGAGDPAEGLSRFPDDFIERFVAAGEDRGGLEREAAAVMACRSLSRGDSADAKKWIPIACAARPKGQERRMLIDHLIGAGRQSLARGRIGNGLSLMYWAFRIRPSRALKSLARPAKIGE